MSNDSPDELFREALALHRAVGHDRAIAHTVRHVPDVKRELGRDAQALESYREALALYRGHPKTNPLEVANALRGMALLRERMGEAGEARELWTEASALYRSSGVEAGVEESERRLAYL